MTKEEITYEIIGAAIDVHKILGPGLFENTYEKCLVYELQQRGLMVREQINLPIDYKEIKLDVGYRIDLIVEDEVVVELKAVKELLPIHEAQILTYLKLSKMNVGLLINFNEVKLTNGIKRFINE
ncbi:MAG: GxxExxY protein [Bacteroidetes bacterium]|nr:MAG: GxxExxY protein [Bacteroidota bacterium]